MTIPLTIVAHVAKEAAGTARTRVLSDDEIRALWPNWTGRDVRRPGQALLFARRRDEVATWAAVKWAGMASGPFQPSATRPRNRISFRCRRPRSRSSMRNRKRPNVITCFPREPGLRFQPSARTRLARQRHWRRFGAIGRRGREGRRQCPIRTLRDWAHRKDADGARRRRPDVSERVLRHVIAASRGRSIGTATRREARCARRELSALIERILNPAPPNIATFADRRGASLTAIMHDTEATFPDLLSGCALAIRPAGSV